MHQSLHDPRNKKAAFRRPRKLEREKRFEPSTLSLATRCSTTELLPQEFVEYCLFPVRLSRGPLRRHNVAVRDLGQLRQELETIAFQAGRIAQETRRELRRELKADGSIVTEADRRVESFVRTELERLAPGTQTWGEEEGFSLPGPDGLWLVDPIDGTSNFAFGSPLWGISIGLAQGEDLTTGVVFLPDFNELYSAHLGGGATLNRIALPPVPPGSIRPEELVSYGDDTLEAYGHAMIPGKMRYSGAFVVEAAWVFQQRFRGMINHKANLYDAAASLCIARELGLDCRYVDGTEIEIAPILAARKIEKTFYIFPAESGFRLPLR